MIVILRSLSFSIVLVAMIAGTPQPVPINIGINDLPDKLNFLKILSMTKATLAIYPHPSRNANKKNNTNICGTNPNTAPTPPIIPSLIRLTNHSATFKPSRKLTTLVWMISGNNTSLTQSVAIDPTVVIDR